MVQLLPNPGLGGIRLPESAILKQRGLCPDSGAETTPCLFSLYMLKLSEKDQGAAAPSWDKGKPLERTLSLEWCLVRVEISCVTICIAEDKCPKKSDGSIKQLKKREH